MKLMSWTNSLVCLATRLLVLIQEKSGMMTVEAVAVLGLVADVYYFMNYDLNGTKERVKSRDGAVMRGLRAFRLDGEPLERRSLLASRNGEKFVSIMAS